MLTFEKVKTLISSAKNITDTLLTPGFSESKQTPLKGEDKEDKDYVIDFLNSNMGDQGVHILSVFSDVKTTDTTLAIIDDIFEEGVLVRYLLESNESLMSNNTTISEKNNNKSNKNNKQLIRCVLNSPESKTVFIPFRSKNGNPFSLMYLLAAEAQIRQGVFDDVVAMVLPFSNEKHDFTVTKSEFVSKNMIRICIKSKNPIPQDDPGYAYRFALTKSDSIKHTVADIMSIPIEILQKVEPKLYQLPFMSEAVDATKKYCLLTALEVYKRIPQRQSDTTAKTEHKQSEQQASVEQAEQEQKPKKARLIDEKRYYTLRQLKNNVNPNTGEVDIYIHDNTAGSTWAQSLKAGDRIKVDNHYPETIKNMTIGQPLFICDETSMPSVAAMLERWQLDSLPIVISITNDKADFSYFNDMVLPDSLKGKLNIQHIVTSEVDNLADRVIELIKAENKKIDCAWGAIGKADFRPIKQYLRNEHGLKGSLNRVRAYWV